MTGDKITLGFAGISDSESISQIEKQCFSEPWSASAVHDFLGYNFNRILCAVIDGKISGYVSFTFIPNEIEIQNVAVHKAAACALVMQMTAKLCATDCSSTFCDV